MGAMNANAGPNTGTLTDSELSREFIAFACELGVLRFGEFKTKAGRLSPYFFNAGLFCDGASLASCSRRGRNWSRKRNLACWRSSELDPDGR